MEKQQSQQIKKYFDVLWRKKILIIALLYVSFLGGLAYYLITPKVFQASTLLSYQQQKVSPNKMSPDLASRIKDIVSTLTQIVTSRTNLEQMIKDFNLYQNMREKLPIEDVIEKMREQISIKPSKQGDTFLISFKGNDPRKVLKVTNGLAAKFIEENLKYREERATETSAYTGDELQMAKEVLDKKELVMRDYKLKYYNEMPEQRLTNVSRLIALQEQYQGKQESIQDLERTRVLIQDQIVTRKKLLAKSVGEQALDGEKFEAPQSANMDNYQRLAQLNAILENLLIKYKETHPEVKRIRKIIGKLKDEIARDEKKEGPKEDSDIENLSANDLDDLRLEIQMKEISLNIDALNREKKKLKETISQYEKWVEAAPVREAEWAALTREYGELKRHYDFLVSQNLQAKSMLHLERRQKGSQFKIEDPARFPEKPIQPDLKRILVAALLLALGLGCGIALGVDLLDTSFRDANDVEGYLGLPVVTSVAYISLEEERRKEKAMTVFWSGIFFISSVAVVGIYFYLLTKKLILV